MSHNVIKEFFLLCGMVSMVFLLSQETKYTPTQITDQSVSGLAIEDSHGMKPLTSELLSKEMNLPHCPWIKIIEWRASEKNRYGPSLAAQKVLGDTCRIAVKNFPIFLKLHKFNVSFDKNFHQDLCLIPIGNDARNLNDISFRFTNREKTYDPNGRVDVIWGYTDFVSHTTFMRNDIIDQNGLINKEVVTVFAHELYHAMSWYMKVNDIYRNDSRIEEKMAQEFTEFMKLGK